MKKLRKTTDLKAKRQNIRFINEEELLVGKPCYLFKTLV